MRIIFFAFVFFTGSSIAQTKNADSLERVIASVQSGQEKVKAYIALADIYTTKDFNKALALTSAGTKLAEQQKDNFSIGRFEQLAGLAWYFKGSYDSAAVKYYAALSRMELAGNKRGKAGVLNDLGRMYRKTRDLDRALKNYDEAFAIYDNLDDDEGRATILNESGVVFEYREDYPEAINRYRQSLGIRERMKDEVGKGYSLNFIGGAYTLQKKFTEAEDYLNQSLQIRLALKDSFSIALNYTDLAYMFTEKKDYVKAVKAYQMSNSIASVMHYPDLMAQNYEQLSGIAEKQGDSRQALEYFRMFSVLKDSIYDQQKIKQVEELNAKYETAEKEQQLEQQRESIKTKNFLLIAGAITTVLLFMAGFNIYRRKQAQSRLQLQQMQMQEQDLATRSVLAAEENERKRIASDLHDGLGQMMSAVKMNLSAFENNTPLEQHQKIALENIMGMVDESCKEIRTVSHQMMPNALLKSGLANAIKDFVDKIDSRVIKVSLYTEGLNEAIDQNVETVLYRVIQECVNNVLKHSGANHLDISLTKESDGIAATIEDNGRGFDPAQLPEGGGIGLNNIASRIQYLKGTIEFDSVPGRGTVIAMHIPLNN